MTLVNHTTTLPLAGQSRFALVLRAPLLLLLSATVLFALGPAVLKLLTQRGAGAISFCNVLFVGNLCAGLVTLVFKSPKCIVAELATLPRRTHALLFLAALVSTIYPALLFIGLEQTSVTNVVLLSRFNGIVYVALGWLVLKDRVPLPQFVGYAVIAVGVGTLIIANNSGFHIQSGDLFVLAATLFFALTEIISRKVLPHVSVQTYVFFRNFVSSIIFFATAVVLFGPHHFMDAWAGDLWVLMLAYALFAIVAAQILWLNATRVLPAKAVADVQLLNPIFSILFAFVLLGEVPMPMQWLVIAILTVGMLLPRLWRTPKPTVVLMPFAIDTGLVGK